MIRQGKSEMLMTMIKNAKDGTKILIPQINGQDRLITINILERKDTVPITRMIHDEAETMGLIKEERIK